MKKLFLALAASASLLAFAAPAFAQGAGFGFSNPFAGGYCADSTGVIQLDAKKCAQMQRLSERVPHLTAADWALAQPEVAGIPNNWTEIQGREGGSD